MLYFLDPASGIHLPSSPREDLREFTITLPLSPFLCSNDRTHPRVASSFTFVSFPDGYQIYYQVYISLYVWPLSTWVYAPTPWLVFPFSFLWAMSLGITDWPSHQPCSVLMTLLPLPSPLRLEPLGSRCQLDLNQSCYMSENCQGVANYKPHFSWLPYLSQSSSHSAYSCVSKYPQRNFPKLTWSLPFSKS